MAANLSLEIGKRALIAQRLGLDVTSSNIANVNTPGYSRRQAVLSETTPLNTNGSFLGTGAMVDSLRNFREEYFDKEIRSTLSRSSFYESEERIMQRLEAVLAEPSESGINEMMTDFFNAYEDLSTQPENIGMREHVVQVAQTLVGTFRDTASQLKDTRTEILTGLNGDVKTINKLTKEIAVLNDQISLSKAKSGTEFQSMVDAREEKLEELAKLVGITVTQGNVGAVNVFVNGINIVSGNVSAEIKLQENLNSVTGESTMRLAAMDSNGNVINYLSPESGEINSLMKHYNVTFDPNDSSGGYSVAKKLDELASALAQKVNSLTVGGYGLNEGGATPPGRSFFEPSVGTVTASNITIAASILNDPRNIPLSDAPNESGNNAIALKIANLKNDGNFISGMNPVEYYASMIEKIGSMGNEAIHGRNNADLVSQQLTSQRESVIGVNLDEEAVNLIKYQKAFEASSRIVNMTNEILATIVNLGK